MAINCLCGIELKTSQENYEGKCTTCAAAPRQLVEVLREILAVLREEKR